MNVLVTGGTGLIGSHLLEHLLARGYRVRCLVRINSNRIFIQNKGVEIVYGDILDKSSLESAIKGVEYIYHLAAVSKRSIPREEFYRINVSGTKNLLNACYKYAPN